MATKFLDKLKNIPTAFQNAMLGTPVQGLQPESSINYSYPQNINDFVSNMKTQEWAQPLFNQQTGYTDNQLVERIGNGLNDGYKQIADFQAQNNIRTPKTGEEINLANLGEFNQYPQIQTGIANEPRQGGVINDFMTGARENYNEGFNPNNFGQKKNWATRAGEFIGSVGRFADSAPGRALIAGGLIGALGGNPTETAAYGLSAGVGRQQNRMLDQLYRNQLEEQGIDTSNIRGMVDKDTFNSIGNMQNKVVNTVLKQQATESMNKLRELQAEKLRIENSVLPEMQKAKLIQEIAKAEHAEEMQLAKIQFYANNAALGWANYGLRASAEERAQSKEEREAAEAAAKEARRREIIEAIKTLQGGEENIPNTPNQSGTGGSNQFVKVQDPATKKVYNVPKSRVNEMVNTYGGKIVG